MNKYQQISTNFNMTTQHINTRSLIITFKFKVILRKVIILIVYQNNK